MIDIETLSFVEVKANRATVRQHKGDLLSIMINTRLPVAIAVPRYRVDIETGQIDENGIVVEFYTLGSARGRVWIEPAEKSLEADIENELKPLMQNITLLRENADDYRKKVRGKSKEEGKNL
jgi:predicted membrane-bound dolichyl-phosphate-mannose-protein mannosyltransferase